MCSGTSSVQWMNIGLRVTTNSRYSVVAKVITVPQRKQGSHSMFIVTNEAKNNYYALLLLPISIMKLRTSSLYVCH